MKKIAFTAVILLLATSHALAADLPYRKAPPVLPPPPAPLPMWTGFYAGLNAGYGFGANSNAQSIGLMTPPALVSPIVRGNVYSVETGVGYALSGNAPQNQNGFIGGGQIGYNYQWGSNFLIGIEADIQGTDIRGNSHAAGVGANSISAVSDPLTATNSFNSAGMTSVNAGVDWMGTVRGRLGYLLTPTMLVYATGGLTYGGVHANIRNFAVENAYSTGTVGAETAVTPVESRAYFGGGTRSQTLVGWNVGGGLEWMFMPNWSLKAEGIYWNMGSQNVQTVAFSAANVPAPGGLYGDTAQMVYGGTRVNYQGVIARAGLNYHFNWAGGASVAPKY